MPSTRVLPVLMENRYCCKCEDYAFRAMNYIPSPKLVGMGHFRAHSFGLFLFRVWKSGIIDLNWSSTSRLRPFISNMQMSTSTPLVCSDHSRGNPNSLGSFFRRVFRRRRVELWVYGPASWRRFKNSAIVSQFSVFRFTTYPDVRDMLGRFGFYACEHVVFGSGNCSRRSFGGWRSRIESDVHNLTVMSKSDAFRMLAYVCNVYLKNQ